VSGLLDRILSFLADTDQVIEEGTSGIWTYRKWKSGIAECWGKTERTLTIDQAWGSMYGTRTAQVVKENFPTGLFIAKPNITVSTVSTSGYSGFISSDQNASSTNTGGFSIARPTTASNVKYDFCFQVKGRWKA